MRTRARSASTASPARRSSTRAAEAPPEGFDPVAHVTASLARVPWTWEAEVLLDLEVERARERLGPVLAELSESEGGTLLRIRAESLDWLAAALSGLDCRLRDPPAGRAAGGRRPARRPARGGRRPGEPVSGA